VRRQKRAARAARGGALRHKEGGAGTAAPPESGKRAAP
jgi:hypothetical protein